MSVFPLIKVCGITDPEDVHLAAKAGADRVGWILWPRSARSVSIEAAEDITQAAREAGVEAVAVLVEESLEEAQVVVERTRVERVQLHGAKVRGLKDHLNGKSIPVFEVDEQGLVEGPLPLEGECLFDTPGGGTGIPFSWKKFDPPRHLRWWLAGGLNPENVNEAITTLRPYGVDVAGGVRQNPRRLDLDRLRRFCEAVKEQS